MLITVNLLNCNCSYLGIWKMSSDESWLTIVELHVWHDGSSDIHAWGGTWCIWPVLQAFNTYFESTSLLWSPTMKFVTTWLNCMSFRQSRPGIWRCLTTSLVSMQMRTTKVSSVTTHRKIGHRVETARQIPKNLVFESDLKLCSITVLNCVVCLLWIINYISS